MIIPKLQKRNKISYLSILVMAILSVSLSAQVQASSEIIDSNYLQGYWSKTSVVLYKDMSEIDPSYDYYAIKVILQDTFFQNSPDHGPFRGGVRIAVPDWAEEVPTDHSPTAGIYSSQTSVSFSYSGIGFNVYLPAHFVSYSASSSGGYRYFDWWVQGDNGGIEYGFIFDDYSEFAVGIRVPQNYKPYAYVQGQVYMYYRQFLGGYLYIGGDNLYWIYVDPPGVTLLPQLPTLHTVHLPYFIRSFENIHDH